MNCNQLKYLVYACIVMLFAGCFGNKATNSNSKTRSNRNTSVADPKLPNIIFYLSDDQDIYDYGCYGNEKVKTPAVDWLLKEEHWLLKMNLSKSYTM